MFVRRTLLWILLVSIGSSTTRAVILFGSGDPSANTTPPSGTLRNSGWVSQTDTAPSANAISPHHLLTAKHIGFRVGEEVRFDGLVYRIQRILNAPEGDLQMLEVAGRMDSNRLAAIYTESDEAGRGAVIHGHGRNRGEPVYRDGPAGPVLRGWTWGTTGSRLRWGTNTIIGAITYPGYGSYLTATFSGNAGADEAGVSTGDSGGGIFLRAADGRWKLAGLMFDTGDYVRQTPTSPPFAAALFDRRGFYSQDPAGKWIQLPAFGIEPGCLWQATRVSFHQAWIAQQIAQPTTGDWPRLLSATTLEGPFTEHPAYAVNPSTQRVTFKAGEQRRFFQLTGPRAIQAIRPTGGLIELSY